MWWNKKNRKAWTLFFLVITEKYLINWFSVTVHTEKHLKMTLIRFDVKHSAMAAIFTWKPWGFDKWPCGLAKTRRQRLGIWPWLVSNWCWNGRIIHDNTCTLWWFNKSIEHGQFVRWFTYIFKIKMVIFQSKLLVYPTVICLCGMNIHLPAICLFTREGLHRSPKWAKVIQDVIGCGGCGLGMQLVNALAMKKRWQCTDNFWMWSESDGCHLFISIWPPQHGETVL